VGRQRQAQDPGGAGIGDVDAALAVEHDHAGAQVVEDGLQPRAGAFELAHAALHLLARLAELIGHLRKGARELAQLVAGRRHRLHAQIAGRHLLHAFGQQGEQLGQAAAEQRGQQHRKKHRQHRGQRERADVQAAQAVARQRALLELAVRRLHLQRIGHQLGRQRRHQQQITLLLAGQRNPRARQPRQHAQPRRRPAAGGGGFIVETFETGGKAGRARLPQHRRRRPLRRHHAGAGAHRDLHLAGCAHQCRVARAEVVAGFFQRRGVEAGTEVAQALGGAGCLFAGIGRQAIQRLAAQAQAGAERGFHPRIEPGFDVARDELVAHRVDDDARHHRHQREHAHQLEQQPAAELAPPQPDRQPRTGDHDHQRQQHRHAHVEPVHPHPPPLVDARRLHRQRDHEREHQHDAEHRHQRDGPGPAGGFGHGLTPPPSCARIRAPTRSMRPRSTASAAAVARCPAGS
jgi:hypothetical protein